MQDLKRLWGRISIHRQRQLFMLLVVMLLASVCEVVSIGALLPFLGVMVSPEKIFDASMVQPIVKMLSLNKANELLLPLTLVFIGLTLLSGLVRLSLLWMQTRIGHLIGADLSGEVYKNTLYQPYIVHISRNSSEIISAISSKTNSVVLEVVLPLLQIVGLGLILFSIMTALIFINPFFALVSFVAFGSLYLSITFLTKSRIAINSERVSFQSTRVIKFLQEGLGGIRDVLIDGTQDAYYDIYKTSDMNMRRSVANIQIMAGAPRFLIEGLGISLIAALAYYFATNGNGLMEAIPLLGVMAIGAQRLLPIMQQIYHSLTAIRGAHSSLSDVLDLLDQTYIYQAKEISVNAITFEESIELVMAGFRYSETSPWVLQKINLNIQKGSRVGVIGKTGSGKSTLLDVVMGLLALNEGYLAIDGQRVTKDNYRAWQKHISHVPQFIYLADATISENIAFGLSPDKIDYKRVRIVAQQAQIASTIESWEGQYETLVGERGVRLSGGQRQRIGIARALYRNTDVIVFDEATSALDNETEEAVIRAIESIDKNITILIIAHRLSTLRACDCIVNLENGNIKAIHNQDEIASLLG